MSYGEWCPTCGEPTINVCRCPIGHAGCANRHEYFRKDSKKLEYRAEKLYCNMLDNNPIIHSNRFAIWSELSNNEKEEWIKKALLL